MNPESMCLSLNVGRSRVCPGNGCNVNVVKHLLGIVGVL